MSVFCLRNYEASASALNVRVGRIELPCPAWKAGILPLNYTRRCNEYSRSMRKNQKVKKYETLAFLYICGNVKKNRQLW